MLLSSSVFVDASKSWISNEYGYFSSGSTRRTSKSQTSKMSATTSGDEDHYENTVAVPAGDGDNLTRKPRSLGRWEIEIQSPNTFLKMPQLVQELGRTMHVLYQNRMLPRVLEMMFDDSEKKLENGVTQHGEMGEDKVDLENVNANGVRNLENKSEFWYGEEVKERFNRILKNYEGTHNFHNFTSRIKAEDPSAKRYIMSFTANTTLNVDGIEFVKC